MQTPRKVNKNWQTSKMRVSHIFVCVPALKFMHKTHVPEEFGGGGRMQVLMCTCCVNAATAVVASGNAPLHFSANAATLKRFYPLLSLPVT